MHPIGSKAREQSPDQRDQANDNTQPDHSVSLR
jgi:hypothetical protein